MSRRSCQLFLEPCWRRYRKKLRRRNAVSLLDLCLPDERVQRVHQLLELRLAVVHARDDAADGTHDVGVHRSPDEHGEDQVRPLHVCLRRHVAVPHRARRHHREINRRDVPRKHRLAHRVLIPETHRVHARAVVVLAHPVTVRVFDHLDEVPQTRHPVSDEQRADDELGELQYAVVDDHVVLEPREDPRAAQDPQELREGG